MQDWALYFFIYSVIGWICETVFCSVPQKRFVNRGFLSGPYCPVYGCGALLIILLLRPLEENIILLFFGGVFLTSGLEYVTGWGMEKLFHHKWWDYSNHRFHIHGRVCMTNSLLFGLLCVIVVKVLHPCLSELLTGLSETAKFWIAAAASVVMAADTVETVKSVMDINRTLAALSRLRAELEEKRARRTENFALARREFQKRAQELALRVGPFQRRIFHAFPEMRSVKYQERLEELRTMLRRRMKLHKIAVRRKKRERNNRKGFRKEGTL